VLRHCGEQHPASMGRSLLGSSASSTSRGSSLRRSRLTLALREFKAKKVVGCVRDNLLFCHSRRRQHMKQFGQLTSYPVAGQTKRAQFVTRSLSCPAPGRTPAAAATWLCTLRRSGHSARERVHEPIAIDHLGRSGVHLHLDDRQREVQHADPQPVCGGDS
jgi:hypothetical protein